MNPCHRQIPCYTGKSYKARRDLRPTMETPTYGHEVIDDLTRILAEDGYAVVRDADHLHINGQSFELRVRSLQAAGERIAETIALHLLRSADDVARQHRQFLIILIPRMPSSMDDVMPLLTDKTFAQHARWAVLSQAGGYRLWLGDGKVLRHADTTKPKRMGVEKHIYEVTPDPFANDASRAVVKALVLRELFPKSKLALDLLDIGGLAVFLQQSRSRVYAVIGNLARLGLLHTSYSRLPTITDSASLMATSLVRARMQTRAVLRVAPLYEPEWKSQRAALGWLQRRVAEMRSDDYAIDGWWACRMHGLDIIDAFETKPVSLVVRNRIETFLKRWELRVVVDGPSHLTVSVSPEPACVFPFLNLVRPRKYEELPVVDPWQAALDVARDPQRGIEQAQAILSTLSGQFS